MTARNQYGELIGTPTPPPGFTDADLVLWRRVMRKMDRWYSVASVGAQTQVPVAPSTNGSGQRLVGLNLARVGLQIYCAENFNVGTVWWTTNGAFSVGRNNLPQRGQHLSPASFLEFDQEYIGEVWVYNTLPSTSLTFDIIELSADDTVWPP